LLKEILRGDDVNDEDDEWTKEFHVFSRDEDDVYD